MKTKNGIGMGCVCNDNIDDMDIIKGRAELVDAGRVKDATYFTDKQVREYLNGSGFTYSPNRWWDKMKGARKKINPEPLKGKKMDFAGYGYGFYSRDMCSAVEWLKGQIVERVLSMILRDEALKCIDEAFADCVEEKR